MTGVDCCWGCKAVKHEFVYVPDRGNTVCHLKTDELLLCWGSSKDSAVLAGADVAESSSKANEAGRGGNGSGELAGDKGSKSKEEH